MSMTLLGRDGLANTFYGARPAMDEIFGFLHMSRTGQPDTAVPQSSQTLALDVFGTLKFARSRDRICDHLAILLETPDGGPWEIHLEYVDPDNTLNEAAHKSQLDVLLQGARSLIAIECKFAETRLEPCGQTGKTGKGLVQCTGNYETQVNPSNGRTALCALTGKNIRYWEYVPRVFRLSAEGPHRPCPFAGPWYQWMRTLVMAYALAEKRGLKPAVGLVHVDRPAMPLRARIQDEAPKMKRLLTDAVKFELLRYEKLPGVFEVAADPGERGLFRDLQHWVDAKVNWVEARLMNERAGRKSPAR
jgi:hypothetical protein